VKERGGARLTISEALIKVKNRSMSRGGVEREVLAVPLLNVQELQRRGQMQGEGGAWRGRTKMQNSR